MRVDRRLWLTADKKKLVEDGSPNAAFLWAIAGRDVPDAEAARLGYKPKAVAKKPADKPKAAAVKKSTPPSENPPAGGEPEFDDMTLEQLQAYALEHDVDLDGADTVEAAVEKLTAAADSGTAPA